MTMNTNDSVPDAVDSAGRCPHESEWDLTHHPEITEEYKRLRATCPLAYNTMHGGFWTLSRFDDVVAAARDFKRFRAGRPFIEVPAMPNIIPLSVDPPEHTPYRQLMNKYIRPNRIENFKPHLRDFVVAELEPIITAGSGDIAAGLAHRLPPYAVALLMGLDDSMLEQLNEAGVALQSAPSTEAVNELVVGLWGGMVADLVASRRANPLNPETDLMSGVLASEIHGRTISDDEAIAIGVQIFGAGSDTTTGAISSMTHFFATHPEEQQRVRENPDLVPTAVDEILRMEPPLGHLGRIAGEDIEMYGRTIHKGDVVALNWASANRDSEVFERADEYVLDRNPNRHVTFGFGTHRCFGTALARAELNIVLTELLARTSSFTLAGEPTGRWPSARASYFSVPLFFVPAN